MSTDASLRLTRMRHAVCDLGPIRVRSEPKSRRSRADLRPSWGRLGAEPGPIGGCFGDDLGSIWVRWIWGPSRAALGSIRAARGRARPRHGGRGLCGVITFVVSITIEHPELLAAGLSGAIALMAIFNHAVQKDLGAAHVGLQRVDRVQAKGKRRPVIRLFRPLRRSSVAMARRSQTNKCVRKHRFEEANELKMDVNDSAMASSSSESWAGALEP